MKDIWGSTEQASSRARIKKYSTTEPTVAADFEISVRYHTAHCKREKRTQLPNSGAFT